MRNYNVAIVGATRLAGQELLKVLRQRHFPFRELRLFSTNQVTERRIVPRPGEPEIEELDSHSFRGIDITFFCTEADSSAALAPIAVRSGATVIDSSYAFRMTSTVPLVVPEVNLEDLQGHAGLIANPSPLTVQLVMALYPLHKVNPLKRVIVAACESVSAAGAVAVEELSTQTNLILEGRPVIPHVFPHQIAFNLLPEVDVFLDNGYSREEWSVIQEMKRIMHAPDLAVSATAVRVPVYVGHSAVLHIELSHELEPDEVTAILTEAPGIRIMDDPAVSLYPQPWSVAGQDEVCAGRLRQDVSHPHGIILWVVADNLRRGIGLNAVQIAEALIERGWLRRQPPPYSTDQTLGQLAHESS
ncbi:MAG: aspartate-semialdehyde dehydrogenase [Chloroflexi bacterium]|nr:aspartate-semialdehyde dehydrogenase [Chloroflexota bacterium]MCL5076484.1 aspartate-semialdehyde dehydrogenase [Chloroflexota bacterium]